MARPYQIATDRHILSAFAERTGQSVSIAEMRTTVGNWISQTLLHTVADPAQITLADLAEYATSRGVKTDANALTRILRTLQNSIPLQARWIPKYNSWRIGTDLTIPVPSLATFQAILGSEYANETNSIRVSGSQRGGVQYFPVISWVQDAALNTALDAMEAAHVRSSFIDRNRDPVTWFKTNVLGASGFDTSLVKFVGAEYITGNMYPGSEPWSAKYDDNDSLLVVTPPDWRGYFGVFSYPRVSNAMVWDSMSYGLVNESLSYCKLTHDDGFHEVSVTNILTAMNSVHAYGYGDIYKGSLAYEEFVSPRAGFTPRALPAGLQTLFVDKESLLAVTKGVGSFWVQSSHWSMAKPTIFADILFGATTFSYVADPAGSYLEAKAENLGLQMPMAGLREYVTWQSQLSGVDAVSKAQLQKFLADTADKEDVMIRATVVATPVTPPSKAEVAATKLVSKCVEADIDIWNEVIDGGTTTFTTLANKLDRDRTDGRTYVTFATTGADSVGQERLVSARVAATLGNASLWNVGSSGEGLSTIFTGSYNGLMAESLTAYETAVIMTNGGVWIGGADDSDLDPVLGDNWRSEFSSLTSADVTMSSSADISWESAQPRSSLVLSVGDFCDSKGYPVVQYADRDTQTRACLLFKGAAGDPSNMVAAAYFVNLL